MTKIDIISGFLGAGKTTFIKKMIDEAFKGEQIVLIENEFGEVGIDGGFLKDAGIQITEMNSGCICCSLVGDFGKNLNEVITKYHPDRILIEPSGVGKLSDVMKSVIDIEKEQPVKLNALVTVVNALKASKQMKAFGEFFNNQIEYATTVILSRSQNATPEQLEFCVKQIQALNPKASVITTDWDAIKGEQILKTMEGQDNLEMKVLAEARHAQDEAEHHHHHDHDEHEHHHDHDEHEHHHDHDEHEHHHDHDHARGDHHHHHEHRGLAEILDILSCADLTPRARELAEHIFTILGRAEAKAHGATLETVHFHEVGAVDSIVDITAAAVCLDNLGIEEVILPILYEGTGTIRCAHGVLPIPVPAVVNIAAAEHLNLHITTARGEYVTPTGAAIAAAIRTSETLPAAFTVEKIGLGAGKREQELPGFVRAMLIHPHSAADGDAQDTICKLETNIDDCTGEALGYVMERLMAAGARDVYYTPVYMKKNRPAYLLEVLCLPEDAAAMEQIIFSETTTIGIRRVKMERCVLKRRLRAVQTSLGSVQVKECEVPAKGDAVHIRCYPEY